MKSNRTYHSLHYEKFADGTVNCIENKIPFEIPKGWEWSRLGSISNTILYGLNNSAKSSGTHRLLRITDIQDGKVDWDSVPFTTVATPDEYLLAADDIVFARTGATVGKSFLIKDLPYESVYASYLIRIRLMLDLMPEYFYQFFNSGNYWMQINDKSIGVGQPNCNGTSLRELLIPIPPVSEQIRVVSVAKEALKFVSMIDNDKEELVNTINQTKARILDLAIRGKLVPQDAADEPASVLLERIRAEKEELIRQGKIKRNKGESVIFKGEDNSYYDSIPDSWEIVSLKMLTSETSLNDGDWILSENMCSSSNIKLIQLGSVGNTEYIDKGFKYISEQTFNELKCSEIFPNYILINRIISDRMNVCLVPEIEGKLITTVDTCWIAPSNYYNSEYLMYALSSSTFQKLVKQYSRGTTRKRISKNNLINIAIPFPPISEQNRIVAKIKDTFKQLSNII